MVKSCLLSQKPKHVSHPTSTFSDAAILVKIYAVNALLAPLTDEHTDAHQG